MKKFISSMLLVAVAIISATLFTSCSKDDDPATNKEENKEGYFALAKIGYSPDYLDIYNVSVTFTDAKNKTQTYDLTPSKASSNDNEMYYFDLSLADATFPVKVLTTVKCSKKAEELVDDKQYKLYHGMAYAKGISASNDSFNKLNADSDIRKSNSSGLALKKEKEAGKTVYESNASADSREITIN